MHDGTHDVAPRDDARAGDLGLGARLAPDAPRPLAVAVEGPAPREAAGAWSRSPGRLGVAVVGLGGAVATTAVAGVALLRAGLADATGLPLAGLPAGLAAQLAAYEDLVFGGWDLSPNDLAAAAAAHRVLERDQLEAVRPALAAITPWPAVGSARYCRNIDGEGFGHRVAAPSARAAVERVREDLRAFRARHALDGVVMLNLASTEARPDLSAPAFATPEGFEAAVDADDPALNPAVLYAYAALLEGVPYGNFTPSVAVDVPALAELARRLGVPVAGKDGKTGQTFVKTVVAPALRERALHVEGWYSHNILGNRDGLALRDRDALSSKLGTKGSVLDGILGYPVEDHVVTIEYYRPRGDNKEAWDTIDLRGFLGQPMQLKLNFLCRDSILAAPLAIEIARTLDLARRRGEGGVQEQLGAFFKQPATRVPGAQPEHGFPEQQRRLLAWLAAGAGAAGEGLGEDAPAPRRAPVPAPADDLVPALAAAERPAADVLAVDVPVVDLPVVGLPVVGLPARGVPADRPALLASLPLARGASPAPFVAPVA
jgi:myo-inositol-1-phosphate synthase